MATHSRTLAWRIPWTEEPGRLQSMALRRVRHHFHFSLSCVEEVHGNPLQYSCLKNPRDRGAWWAAVYGIAQNRTQLKRLSSSSIYVNPNLPVYPSLTLPADIHVFLFVCLVLFLKLAHRLIRNGDRT